MKKNYISPVTEVIEIEMKESYLLTMSAGDTLGIGGNTSDEDFTSADTKGSLFDENPWE